MRTDTGSSHSAELRQAALNLLEAEYQLELRRHHQQQEDYISKDDVSGEWNKYKSRIKHFGGYAAIALIAYAAMTIANMGGVIKDVAFVVLLVTGIPTAYHLLRMLLTIPKRGKAMADERRMVKKWAGFDKAEAACDKQRERLAASLPIEKGKRFVHIPALGARRVYTGFHAEHLRVGGGVNFVEKGDKTLVQGMLDLQPIDADQIREILDREHPVGFCFDRAYLRSHPDETYLMGSVFCFTHSAPLKSHTTRYNQIDVDATMANFDSAFDRAERRASASGRTHQESYDAGKMSFADYRTAEDFKERQMERERKELEAQNTQNTRTVFYYDQITQNVYAAGLIITTQRGRLIYAGYYDAGHDFMRFTYRLPEYVRTTSGGGVPEETANALQGELVSFAQPKEFQGVNQRMVMDYVLQRYRNTMPPFNPLKIMPAGMADNDFRYWIELRYLDSRDKR